MALFQSLLASGVGGAVKKLVLPVILISLVLVLIYQTGRHHGDLHCQAGYEAQIDALRRATQIAADRLQAAEQARLDALRASERAVMREPDLSGCADARIPERVRDQLSR